MTTEKSVGFWTSFWDGFIGNIGAPYGVFALLKSGALTNLKERAGDAWEDISDAISDLEMAYLRKSGRWVQVVSGLFGGIFLLITMLMLGFWNKRAEGFALYQITVLLSAFFGTGFIAYAAWVQGAIPEYARDAQDRLIPDDVTGHYRLSASKRPRFGRISAIGLMIAIVVTFSVMFFAFMTLSVLQQSTALVIASLFFLEIAFGIGALSEKLLKFVAFQFLHFAEAVFVESTDFASVVLPSKLMSDYLANRRKRAAEGKKARPSDIGISKALVLPPLLAVFIHLFWVADHSGFVMWADLCILGMTLVPIIGLLTDQEETVKNQKNFYFSNFVKFAMALTILAKLVEAKWFYAGYVCGLVNPPSEGWKVVVLNIMLVGLGIFLFLVGSKVIKEMRKFTYVMWTAATICFVLGIGTFISALADGGATTQACYENTKARASGQVADPLKDSKAIVVTAPTATATVSASAPTPPPVKDEAAKLAEATVNEIKQARTEIQDSLVEGKKLLSDLKQVSSDRAEGKPTMVALTASEKKATAKTSSAPTSSAPRSSSASTVAIADSDAEVEAARKRLAAKYLQ